MSAWRGEVVGGAFVRRAGVERAAALWLVPALGDSGDSFAPLFATRLGTVFELNAPDLPGAGATPAEPGLADFEALGAWVARTIERGSPAGPVGLVGHSLGAAIAVRAALRLGARVAGVFSIEGNLTEADAYFSGAASGFEDPELFKQDLIGRVRALAEEAPPASRPALWHYHASLTLASADALWRVARSAKAAGADDALGAEYRALAVPTLYYWSPRNTPVPTQAYLREHAIRDVVFDGGHWPMMERPQETAKEIADFFEPLLGSGRATA
jgi:pimeloyl-ACP methyl ester carboxylesterase